jgi:FkbM family methyltransferase
MSDYNGHPDQVFGPISYAQSGEDLIIANVFALIGLARPSYLDIGCHHPIHCSNTAFFYKRGSRGVAVDANPDIVSEFKRERPEDLVLNIGVSSTSGTMRLYRVDPLSGRNSLSKATVEAFVKDCPQFKIWDSIEVETLSLNDLVSRYCNSCYPDLLSVDAEGLDGEILMAADFGKSRPKIICVEDCSQETVTALQQRGFAFYARTWCCSIWLSAEILSEVRGSMT